MVGCRAAAANYFEKACIVKGFGAKELSAVVEFKVTVGAAGQQSVPQRAAVRTWPHVCPLVFPAALGPCLRCAFLAHHLLARHHLPAVASVHSRRRLTSPRVAAGAPARPPAHRPKGDAHDTSMLKKIELDSHITIMHSCMEQGSLVGDRGRCVPAARVPPRAPAGAQQARGGTPVVHSRPALSLPTVVAHACCRGLNGIDGHACARGKEARDLRLCDLLPPDEIHTSPMKSMLFTLMAYGTKKAVSDGWAGRRLLGRLGAGTCTMWRMRDQQRCSCP